MRSVTGRPGADVSITLIFLTNGPAGCPDASNATVTSAVSPGSTGSCGYFGTVHAHDDAAPYMLTALSDTLTALKRHSCIYDRALTLPTSITVSAYCNALPRAPSAAPHAIMQSAETATVCIRRHLIVPPSLF